MNKKERRKIFIVSADDFGMDEEVDRKILELLKAGKIDRLAVFVNKKPLSEEIVGNLLNSGVKIDIHLELPNGNGKKTTNVHRLGNFFFNYLTGKNSRRQVEKFWLSQVEKFHEIFGKYPDGLNSHEHVHLFPFYFSIVCGIAEKYGITFIRIGRKNYFTSNPVSIILGLIKIISRWRYKMINAKTTDYMVSLDWMKDNDSLARFAGGSSRVELVTHPGVDKEADIIMNNF